MVRQSGLVGHLSLNLRRLGPRRLPLGREENSHHTLIALVAQPVDQAGALKAFQQRRQRARIEQQPVRQSFDRLLSVLLQDQHGEVLRLGQANLGERAAIGTDDVIAGAVEREAQLFIEQQRRVVIHWEPGEFCWKL